tara:strand:+ start:1449 stop:1703 length:255 start_codon:yes stop_codon:yes gene_type:complete
MVTDEEALAMEEEYKEQIKLQGKIPMTTKEEYRNADVPMLRGPNDLEEIISRLEKQNQELRLDNQRLTKQLEDTLKQFRNKGAL